jgi:hypothetical protein
MSRVCTGLVLLVWLTVSPFSAAAGEAEEWAHQKDIRKCPKCSAAYDATPHPLDYRQCPKCQAALGKALAYLKKNFKPQMFGLILDSFFGGFAFMMDSSESHEKELAVCAKNCRDLIKPAPDGNFASPTVVGEEWCSWKKSMAMFFLTEYSLRYGLTPENKASLQEGVAFAVKTQQKGGGWFHSGPKETQYSPDIAIIGCIYYAAFLEMKALGLDPGPILDQTRTYLESISDGKTIGYSKGWRGGMGGGGADGFITLGLLASGNADDTWGAGLAGWMKQHYTDAPHGHANGELHYFALGTGLHRLGHEHYAKFATCHVHRLIDIQREDGGIPAMSHDITSETEFLQKQKTDTSLQSSFPATAVFACLLLMERPGAFSPLPSKPVGAMNNKDAFKAGTEALAKNDYAKAFKYFAMVLPRGDAGELVPQAREQMVKIEAAAKQKLEELKPKETALAQRPKDKANVKEDLVAYAGVISAYEKFQKDFEGTATAQEARKLCEPLRKAVADMRMRLAFGGGGAASAASPASASTPGKLKAPDSRKEWDGRLKSRVKAVIAAGTKPRFDFAALKTRMAVKSLGDDDGLKVQLDNGGQLDLKWTQLQPADLRSLALELAASPGSPADHALAAFYLLCGQETAKAEDHLIKAGPEADRVRAAFEAN